MRTTLGFRSPSDNLALLSGQRRLAESNRCKIPLDSEQQSQFRAPRRTVWVEMPNGAGHWASNWELRQIEVKRA